MKIYGQEDETDISMTSIIDSRSKQNGTSTRNTKKIQSYRVVSVVVLAGIETTPVNTCQSPSKIGTHKRMRSDCKLRQQHITITLSVDSWDER